MSALERITLKQLRALRAVARHGTVVAAADTLGLTGPAVHNQLKTLEDVAGISAFGPSVSGGRAPTPEGEVLLRAVEEIDGVLTHSLREIDALRSGASGSVALGVVSTAKYFAPAIVGAMERAMPELSLSLTVGNRSDIIAGLRNFDFDLCIMGRAPVDPPVYTQPLAPHPHVVIAAPDHPLAGRRTLQPSDLAGERFAMRESGSGSRILAEHFLYAIADARGIRTIDMDSNETIKQAVMSGLGISLISAHTVAAELAEGRLVLLDVTGTPIDRTWYLTSPRHRTMTPAAERARDWILEQAAQLIPGARTDGFSSP